MGNQVILYDRVTPCAFLVYSRGNTVIYSLKAVFGSKSRLLVGEADVNNLQA
jgi:hypothetical protein